MNRIRNVTVRMARGIIRAGLMDSPAARPIISEP